MKNRHAHAQVPLVEGLEPRLFLSANGFLDGILSQSPLAYGKPAVSMSPLGGKPGGGGSTSTTTDDYGNTLATAYVAKLSSSGTAGVAGQINYSGDLDMFCVVATVTGTMQVGLNASSTPKGLDPALTVYDALGNQIAYSNDSGKAKNSLVTIDVVAGQKYFFRAAGNRTSTGAYTLGITTTPAQPPPPPPAPSPDPSPTPTPMPDFLPGSGAYVPGTTITGQVVNTYSGLVLIVLGTDSSDVISLSQSTTQVTLVTAQGSLAYDGSFAGIAVYGFGGDDILRLMNSVIAAHVVYGGDGNDQLFENALGAGFVYGQGGDDLLVSVGGGADVVTGGAGFDSFWVDSSDAISDAESAETAAASMHKIAQFYQPYSSDTSSASYVSLEIAGQNLVDPATSYAYRSFAATPLFTDGPDYRDIAQGAAGDCYFLAALASIADSDPGIIRQAIAPLGDGTYVVQYYRNGTANYVRVDADLPASGSSLAYAKTGPDGELWAPLMEKAYASFRVPGQSSYAALDAGNMSTVYVAITHTGTSAQYTSGASASTVFNYLSSNLAAGHPVTAGTYSSTSGPIIGNHAYMVESVQTVDGVQYVTVYNPWGYDGRAWDSNSSDGLVTLTIAQFMQYFSDACGSLV